ncbi:MAG TPA: type VI secretion system baseplate subunit TssF [Polyangiaceae bacterium]|jgi:type VI secretion system protein ImpG|nr:type VI secretion system baseplate subunit TssF [Polyangiaceae bacterium]
MDARLLDYYNRELQHLREIGGEFAKQFPKVAGRLGLDAFECADPYVERLLEGFAFLAARVQLKIDSEFPKFTEQLLEMVCPHYLPSTPSMAVVQFTPSYKQGSLASGVAIPRNTILRSSTGRGRYTPCEYRTAHDVTLWPISLTSVVHTTSLSDLGDIKLPGRRAPKSSLRLRFSTENGIPFNKLSLDRLPLFVRGNEPAAMRLYELALSGPLASVMRPPDRSWQVWNRSPPLQRKGFSDDEALLPYGRRSFRGYRLLHEYFALPSRFLFVELTGLGPAIQRCEGTELEVIVLLDRHDSLVENAVSPAGLLPFATPAINLFPRKADRIHLTNAAPDYHVVADRTRPLDLEVHSVVDVVGFGTSTDVRQRFLPFYACTERLDANSETGSYYAVHRRRRVGGAQHKGANHSGYSGAEVFVSLVDGQHGPFRPTLRQLAVDTLCTNRDLPLQMSIGHGRTDFAVDSGAPVDSVRVVAGPSPPRESHAWGETTWRLISHLSLNYLSISDLDDQRGAATLRELLGLYADLGDAHTRRQIEGVRSVSTSPIVRRVGPGGAAAFARGLEVTLECDETAFEGSSVFLLGSVMEEFFARYASLNSFSETVLRSSQRGDLMRWPSRAGNRPTL